MANLLDVDERCNSVKPDEVGYAKAFGPAFGVRTGVSAGASVGGFTIDTNWLDFSKIPGNVPPGLYFGAKNLLSYCWECNETCPSTVIEKAVESMQEDLMEYADEKFNKDENSEVAFNDLSDEAYQPQHLEWNHKEKPSGMKGIECVPADQRRRKRSRFWTLHIRSNMTAPAANMTKNAEDDEDDDTETSSSSEDEDDDDNDDDDDDDDDDDAKKLIANVCQN